MTSARPHHASDLRRPKRSYCLVISRLGVLSAMLLAGMPAEASPDEVETQCLQAYAGGQRARKAGALAEAKAAFALCAGSTCPAALHPDCSRWLEEVEAATPTSVFHISNPSGEALHGVTVRVDGQPPRKLDGRAVSIDPGAHTLVFESPVIGPTNSA